MTVTEFLAREEAADLLRARRRQDMASLRAALEMAALNFDNDGADRLVRWAQDRYR